MMGLYWLLAKEEYSAFSKRIKEHQRIDSTTISQLSGRIELLYKNHHFKVDERTEVVNEQGDSLSLKELDINFPVFVVRFSEFSCMNCISSEMKKISGFSQLLPNTLCLGTYSRLGDLQMNKRLMGLSIPVYNIAFNALVNGIEEKKMPYYFVLDESFEVRHLFVAEPNNAELTVKYLTCFIHEFSS